MKSVKFLVPALVILLLVVGRALPDRGRSVSGTRTFAIDGRRFLVEDPDLAGLSLIKRELETRGVDAPRGSNDLESVFDVRAVEPLREVPAGSGAPSLPPGLQPDHNLRLETATGPVDITFGRVAGAEKEIVGRLRSSGWDCRESGRLESPGTIAEFTGKKETSVVLMDKNERRFLAFRRAVQ